MKGLICNLNCLVQRQLADGNAYAKRQDLAAPSYVSLDHFLNIVEYFIPVV